MQNAISHLRTFFKISTAAFDFQKTVIESVGGNHTISQMELLHNQALDELRKEEPNLVYIDSLLAEMEVCAGNNANKMPPYQKGTNN